MRKYTIGFAAGFGLALALPAIAAQVTGSNGVLRFWTVSVGGSQVCSDPHVWVSLREIECG